MPQRALIIDGHNYLFKGFYGVPPTAKRSDGTQVNALYGFFSLLRTVLAETSPDYLLITFDAETSIENKLLINPKYKSQRTNTNTDVYLQLPLIKSCLDILGIHWVEDPNNEADDLIGSYSSIFNTEKITTYIGSNDFDFIQLVNRNTFVARAYHGTISKFNSDKVMEHFGILPNQYLEYLALKGDSSDNIEGIKGIGKKRAVSLLSSYHTLSSIYRNFSNLPPLLQKLLLDKEIFLNERKEFLKIKCDQSICNVKPHRDCLIPKAELPKKMGTFLEANWAELVTRAKEYK